MLSLFFAIGYPLNTYSQIGYQVSLLNSATGEPRANEQVVCHVELTDNDETSVWSEDITTTSNEFGVVSLTIGNSSMFKNFKWAEKLPLYVSVKVDNVLIGKSQVLNVPIAEYSKESGVLTPEILCDSLLQIKGEVENSFNFRPDGTCSYSYSNKGASSNAIYHYTINGNDLVMSGTVKGSINGDLFSYESTIYWRYFPKNNMLLIIQQLGGI